MSTGKTYSTKYLLDSNNNRGTEGQVLSTTSTGIDWVDANSVPGTGLWIENGNNIYNSNSGNVGIGTTSPNNILELSKTVDSGIGPILQLTNSQYTNANNSGSSIQFRGYTLWGPGSSNPRYSEINAINGSGSVPKRIEFKFYADTDEKTPLSILQTGRVGVGTTTPGNIFVVESAASASAVEFINTNADANPSVLVLKKLSASPADNDVLGRIIFQGNNDATTPGLRTFARIETVATDVTDGEEDGDLYFYTTNEGNESAKLRILDVGAVQSRTTGLIQLNYRNGSAYSYIAPTVYNNWNRIGTFTNPDSGARIFTEILAKGDNNYPSWMKGTVVVSFYSTGVSVSCQTDGGYMGGHNFQCIVTKDGTTYDVWLRVPTIEWSSFVSYRTLYNSGFTENYIFTIASGNVSNSAPTGVDDETNSIEPNSSFRFVNTDLKTPTHQYRAQNFLIDGSTTVEFQHDKNIFTQKVGIGTTNPSHKLDIYGTGTDVGMRIEEDAGTHSPYIQLRRGGADWVMSVEDDGSPQGKLVFNYENSDKVTFNSSGNVGIGTTSPSYKLDISGGKIQINDGGAAWFGSDSTGAFIRTFNGNTVRFLSSVNAETMRINNATGNVGIGTTSPSEKLEVAGTIKNTTFINTGGQAGAMLLGRGGAMSSTYLANDFLMFNTGGDCLILGTGGAGMIVKATTGNVGIGTTSPNAKLDVQGTQGQLFSVTDDLSGEIFAVADISGVPIMTVNSSGVSYFDGNVGIGTTSPHSQLQVGDSEQTTSAVITIASRYGGSNPYLNFRSGHPSNSNVWNMASIHGDDDGNYNGKLEFRTSNSSQAAPTIKMIIKANGNVGIGTTSPGRELDVHGNIETTGSLWIGATSSTASEHKIKIGQNRSGNGYAYIDLIGDAAATSYYNLRLIRNNTGANATSQIIHRGTGNFSIDATDSADIILNPNSANVGIGTTSPDYKLEVDGTLGVSRTDGIIFAGSTANGNKITVDTSNDFIFSTSLNSAPYTVTERMRIANNGATTFTSTVTATNFILSSDERLKENIEEVCDNRIKADWKTFELKTEKGQKRYGVIAQELEKTNPEFVREDTQGFKSVAYIDLLIAKIAELEARLEKAGI